MDNPKPCPFCGHSVVFSQSDISAEQFMECTNCECGHATFWSVDWSPERCLEAWNKRADSKLAEQNAKMLDMLKKCEEVLLNVMRDKYTYPQVQLRRAYVRDLIAEIE